MHSRLIALSATAVLAALLTACTGGADVTQPTPSPDSASPFSIAPEDPISLAPKLKCDMKVTGTIDYAGTPAADPTPLAAVAGYGPKRTHPVLVKQTNRSATVRFVDHHGKTVMQVDVTKWGDTGWVVETTTKCSH